MSYSTTPIIEFQRFEKRYGRIHAVKPLDLSIQAGETFALLGPNGSGKSTLIRALVGLHAPTAGRILINAGTNTGQSGVKRNLIAYMPQRVSMPDLLTAREVLEFFSRLRGLDTGRVEKALDFVALTGDADRYIREFSGGMLQRLGLAVAFLEEVPIYVLDEPTLNLDPVGVDCFRTRIRQLKERGTTVIFSSHILQDSLQLADRIAILAGGRLVRIETMSAFRKVLSEETRVRVVLEKTSEKIIAAATDAGAKTFSVNNRHYSFMAPPPLRLEIIRAIETAGGVIEEFHTEVPEWEALIKKRFHEKEQAG